MITPPSERKLFLIDAYALIFRAYYAFIKNPRINSKGLNTSAIFGFTNALLDVIRNESPSHIAVVFDAPGGSFRNETYSEYKANREETPEDIKRSVPWILEVLEGLDVPAISKVGFEADDVIGFLAKKAAVDGFDVFMMTPDKDFGQLVTDKIRMFRPGRGGSPAEVWGPAEIREKFDVDEPLQIIDLLGMMGDSADNIPGIPGVGAKTASKLLHQYGSLESVIENAGELKGKLKERVEENTELALLSKELATICLDIPMEYDWQSMTLSAPQTEALRRTLEDLEFRALARRILGDVASEASSAGSDANTANASSEPAQLDLFNGGESSSVPTESASSYRTAGDVQADYQFVATPNALNDLLELLKANESFAFDTETSSLDVMTAQLVGISFSVAAESGFWVPATTEHWTEEELLSRLQPIFADANKEAIAHHFKFDYKMLAIRGMSFANKVFDTMVAHYLIQPEASHKLDRLAETELGYATIPITDLIGKAGKTQKSMADLPVDSITKYACEDADITFQLRQILGPGLAQVAADELFKTVEVPLVKILADMEIEGVRIDSDELNRYSTELGEQIGTLTREIHDQAGQVFNIDSPKQLGPILFETLEIKARVKKTKTGQYPTGEEVLEKIKTEHPIVPAVLRYRKLKKLKSTYVDPLPKLVNALSGRVHTTYQQTVAATGRLSSKDPNLQNIPIRTEEGRAIRKAFIPRDDNHVLLAADYSQVELRIAAALSQDPGLVDAFVQGHDVHTATAAKVFQVDPDAVDRDMRSKAKAVNFGILYGQGAFGLAQNLGIPRREAKEIIDAYFLEFAQLKAFTADCVDRVRETGYAETVLGRRRYLPDIASNNATVRAFAERNAVNAPIQGSAADIIKVAMVRMQAALNENQLNTRMIMQVHDELVFDVPTDEVAQLEGLIKAAMADAVKIAVPLVVDMSTGQNWLEAH
ncbi:MAG: DNA polymerase I [Crocinitomicaceae bacterium]|nr:DNA polymerase I [Crocinitomicaceae bacterium]